MPHIYQDLPTRAIAFVLKDGFSVRHTYQILALTFFLSG
jgi:hypothetical protein